MDRRSPSLHCAAIAVVAVALVCAVASPALALTYKLPAQTEECFYELVEPGTTVSVTFTVKAGGKLDVGARVRAINMQTGASHFVSDWALTTEGTAQYLAPPAAMPHRFEICFNNKMARWTPKWIEFSFFKMLPAHDDGITGEHNKQFQQVEVDLHTCANRVFTMRSRMSKLRTTEAQHRDTMESVVNWIVWGGATQCALLVLLALFEFFYLKRFLEVRAVVRI
jgi:hypothetical protein